MPGQKKKYNVRFPPGRIKKIMQKDTEVGRIAVAVPVIIARALEMFLKSLLTKTCLITQAKFNNIVSVAHMKQCIESEKLFHFLKDLAEGATTTAAQKDNRGMSIWPPSYSLLSFKEQKEQHRHYKPIWRDCSPKEPRLRLKRVGALHLLVTWTSQQHIISVHVIRLWSDSAKKKSENKKTPLFTTGTIAYMNLTVFGQ